MVNDVGFGKGVEGSTIVNKGNGRELMAIAAVLCTLRRVQLQVIVNKTGLTSLHRSLSLLSTAHYSCKVHTATT